VQLGVGSTGEANNGQPADRPEQRRNGGLGLSGMRERALLAGGQLSIWSREGQGTRVELTIV